MARRRKPKLFNCEILNRPFNKEEQEEYDRKVCKALATALHRSLEPEEFNSLIENLRQAL